MVFRKIPVDAAITLGCAEKAAILNELYHVTLEPGMRQNKNYLVVRFRDWQKAFPWMSLRKIQRYIQDLKDLGMIAYVTMYDETGKKGDTTFSITSKGVETLLLRRPETYLDQEALEEESAAARETLSKIISSQESGATNVTSDASPRHQCRMSASPVSQLYKKEQQEEQQEARVASDETGAPHARISLEELAPEGITPLQAPAQTNEKPKRKRRQPKTDPPSPPPPPTIEEWTQLCAEKYPLMPKLRVELAFASQETKGWMRETPKGLAPVKSWKGCAYTSYLKWQEWYPQEFATAKREHETATRNQGSRGPYAEPIAQPFISEIAQIKARQREAALRSSNVRGPFAE